MPTELLEHLSLVLSNHIYLVQEHLLSEDIHKLSDIECQACYQLAELCSPVQTYVDSMLADRGIVRCWHCLDCYE
jgi:hypothetical protein